MKLFSSIAVAAVIGASFTVVDALLPQQASAQYLNEAGGNIYGNSRYNSQANPRWNSCADPRYSINGCN